MKKQAFRTIILLMAGTLLLVFCAQVYRVLDTYQVNKQRFINDVQGALDLAVEAYYAKQAKQQIMVFEYAEADTLFKRFPGSLSTTATITVDSIAHHHHNGTSKFSWDTVRSNNGFSYSYTVESNKDSSSGAVNRLQRFQSNNSGIGTFSFDTLRLQSRNSQRFAQLAEKVMISIAEERLDLNELSEDVNAQLKRKELPIDFQLQHAINGKVLVEGSIRRDLPLMTKAKSTYLSDNESIELSFENGSMIILKRGLFDLLISLLVVLTVLGALIYMYRIIAEQKQLAQIKDELISNITHEFKTPIATISTAIEGISSFNAANDPEKTQRYLSISDDQLKKLNGMVEKLLETATIDSGELQVAKEEVDLKQLSQKVVDNFQLVVGGKQLHFQGTDESIWWQVDPFHLENALSNLIDNAIKYGGEEIKVSFEVENKRPMWRISDNGGNLPAAEKDRVFEKLYRISTGNRHDVKGFGIGLYYTKAIVEKHSGTITVNTGTQRTTFTIAL